MALTLEEKKTLFIAALKETYKIQYDAVQPIPYIKDRLYCVDKVFVEVGVEVNVAPEVTRGAGGSWERLESYKSIYTDFRLLGKRRIIQGEPGYGKSTLTLQLAYDWCNGVLDSPLCNVEILILLRLRQLRGIASIYRAIKLFLLPKESRIKVKDIEDILYSCSSVNITLDGYDEYPERDSNTRNDVNMIIMTDMFVDFDVTLTTRYLPRHFSEATKRAKLTGFDDKARDEYIRKAVVGDNDEAVEQIKHRLRENGILADLCQVPLIFVMFAHMTHEKPNFQQYTSVTSFFQYMINCFHEHLKNKSRDANVNNIDLYANDHTELDKMAFEGLSKDNQQITWDKNEVCERLGRAFYDQYINIGILVEEEVMGDTEMGEKLWFTTKVRFYHKLFCEWYGAHNLAYYASRSDVIFKQHGSSRRPNQSAGHLEAAAIHQYRMISPFRNVQSSSFESDLLNKLDPFDLQYLFRFACGLRPAGGKKIIDYLKSRPGGDKFAILCILEQTGRVDDIMDTIRELCSRQVQINKDDSALLQRSTIQLLEIASSNECEHMYFLFHACLVAALYDQKNPLVP